LNDVRARVRASTVLWVVTFLLAIVSFSRLRTLPDLFLVAAFVAWCAADRLRRTATVAVVAVVFVCLEIFLPFDVSLIDGPGGVKVARVAMGKPGPESMAAAERGEIVLGGCVVLGMEPRWVLVW
jgi:hypothetical protein